MTDYPSLAAIIYTQSCRINAMQRKIDRYKKYARIKHRKEQKQKEEANRKYDEWKSKIGIVSVNAWFSQTWKV